MNAEAHDASGWTANCRRGGRPIWVAWLAHSGTYKRFNLDRETIHQEVDDSDAGLGFAPTPEAAMRAAIDAAKPGHKHDYEIQYICKDCGDRKDFSHPEWLVPAND